MACPLSHPLALMCVCLLCMCVFVFGRGVSADSERVGEPLGGAVCQAWGCAALPAVSFTAFIWADEWLGLTPQPRTLQAAVRPGSSTAPPDLTQPSAPHATLTPGLSSWRTGGGAGEGEQRRG